MSEEAGGQDVQVVTANGTMETTHWVEVVLFVHHPDGEIKMPLRLIVLETTSFELMVGLETQRKYKIDIEGSMNRVSVWGGHSRPTYFVTKSKQEWQEENQRVTSSTLHSIVVAETEELARGLPWQRNGRDQLDGTTVESVFGYSPRGRNL